MKKIISLISALVLVFLSVPVSFAAADSSDFANLIVFVKLSGETKETVNEDGNFARIKSYYDEYKKVGYGYGDADASLKNYVKLASCGKVNVLNYFPQENSGNVNVLTLNETSFDGVTDTDIILQVIDAFKNNIIPLPTQKLDNDYAGVLDNLTIIVEADSFDQDEYEITTLHKGIFGGYDTIGTSRIYNYNILNTYPIFEDSLMEQGAITHEFMHSLGFADLYRYSGTGSPVDMWDIMSSAGKYMAYPLSYMRYKAGWVGITEATTTGHYSLDATTTDDGNVLLKLKSPMSESEFFCLEYRQKNTSSELGFGFDTKIRGSGLLIYRVNTALDDLSNKSPDNDFIYVFRPDDTDVHSAEGNVFSAAVNPDDGEYFYGSSDFSKSVTDNVIFYSDGKNSGITISNIAYNADKSKIEFDVTYPDYSEIGLWKINGDNLINSNAPYASISISSDNNGVIASVANTDYETFTTTGVFVKRTMAESTELTRRNSAGDASVVTCNSEDYYAEMNTSFNSITVFKNTDSGIVNIGSYSDYNSYFGNISMFSDDQNAYIGLVKNNDTIVILRVDNNGVTLIDDSLTAEANAMLPTPAFCTLNGKIYALYSHIGGKLAQKNAMLNAYDTLTNEWSIVSVLSNDDTKNHSLATDGEKIYGVAGASNKTPVYFEYDGQNTVETVCSFLNSDGLSIAVTDSFKAISCITNGNALVFCDTGSGFNQLGSEISRNASNIKIAATENRVWAITATSSGTIVKSKVVIPPTLVEIPGSGSQIINENSYILLPKESSSLIPLLTVLGNGRISTSNNTASFYGTGEKIKLYDEDGNKATSYETVVMGDLDGDGAVDVLDSQISELTCSNHLTLSGAKKAAADFNADGNITEEDFTQSVNASLAD